MKSYKFTINGTKYNVDITNVEDQNIQLELNGTPYTVEIDREIKQQPKTPKLVRTQAVPSSDSAPKMTGGGNIGVIKSPLPGVVLDILVKIGDKVSMGQNVVLLEAMKMENNIQSDKVGTVSEIKINKGDSVMEGEVLLIIGE